VLPPPPPGPLLFEAEDFTPEGAGWSRGAWGENYFSGPFANTFLSRKAFLGAASGAGGAVARLTIRIPARGHYLPLVRYEYLYRFAATFRLRVEQGDRVVLDRVYGQRDARKVWAFRSGVTDEKAWPWGANENLVWEGHESPIELEAGPATLALVTEADPEPSARRNVDAVLLTTDTADVEERIAKEGHLPLDGLLTQAGDLYLQVEALGEPQKLTVPPGVEHSPYWVHRRSWKPRKLELKPGEPTGWIEVGSLLDTLNDGQWRLKAAPARKGGAVDLRLTFAVPGAAGPEVIGRFEMKQADLELLYDGSIRKSRHLRPSSEALAELVGYLKGLPPPPGRAPSRTLVYASTFRPRPADEGFEADRRELDRLLGITVPLDGTPAPPPPPGPPPRGLVDLRSYRTLPALEAACRKLVDGKLAERIAVVSMGDEIHLSAPKKDADELFRAFLKERKIRPDEVDPASKGNLGAIRYAPPQNPADNPGLHLYTSLFRHAHGLREMRERTEVVRKFLPHALIGANFSPHHGPLYLGAVHQWVHAFRQGALTLPWGEDYAWAVPIGSPQASSLAIDLLRSAVRGRPETPIHHYIMAHAPGTNPRAWRRQFYAAVAHGVRIFNLFDLVPLAGAPTENYVNDPAMYRAVRDALHELGAFEDLLHAARPRPAAAALWFSEIGDVWNDHAAPFGAELRSLYLGLSHRHLPLDVVVEEDAFDRTLDGYRLIFLSDRHVSRRAVGALARWVERGGTLVLTAGAGLRDEVDRPGKAMEKLLGAEETGLEVDPTVALEKQDLPRARVLGRVLLDGQSAEVVGARWRLRPGKDAAVELRFEDGEPALLRRRAGKGEVVALAFLPGLSYLRPALPLRPVDRGSREDTLAQLLPTAMSPAMASLLGRLSSGVERAVETSSPLVEAALLEGPSGWLVPVIDWTGAATTEVRVTVPAGSFRRVTLASGRPVRVEEQGGKRIATFPLETADALLLR
jgi:hypothetical protein